MTTLETIGTIGAAIIAGIFLLALALALLRRDYRREMQRLKNEADKRR